jgi:hypothetical protein
MNTLTAVIGTTVVYFIQRVADAKKKPGIIRKTQRNLSTVIA